MRIISDNYTQNGKATITATSENVNYPVSNISHQFRSKSWRSSGNFKITTSNNKIDFKESAMGPELTATLTEGSYTPSQLETEIKLQLEEVGAATYTVSYSTTTGRWTISSAGAYLSLLNNSGSNASKSTLKLALGFQNTDRTGATSYYGPKIAIHTEEAILIDMKTKDAINSVVLLWPKDRGLKLSPTAVVTIEANATNNWTSPAVSQILTPDYTYYTYSHYFTTSQEYRFWRVKIVDPQNAYLYVDLSLIIIGQAETITVADRGFKFSTTDTSKVTRTDYGNEYVDEYPMNTSLELGLSVLDYSDAVIVEEMYKRNGTRTPIYVALDETESTFSKNHFSIYGKMQSNLQLSQLNYNIFDTSLVIREIL